MADQGAALLTTGHRDYLQGTKSFDRESHERALVSRLRDRIRQGTIDFSLVLEQLPADTRQEIFKGLRNPSDAEDYDQTFPGLRNAGEGTVEPDLRPSFVAQSTDPLTRTTSAIEAGMIDAIAFFYIAAEDAGLDKRHLIEKGVERAEAIRTDDRIMVNDVTLEVDKDVKHHLAKTATQKIRAGDDLTNAEVRALLETGRGRITAEEIQGYLAGEWTPPEDDLIDPSMGV